MKHKKGDRVRLLYDMGLRGAVKGQIYTIVYVKDPYYLLSIPEGIQHYKYDGTNPGWWFTERCVEGLYKKNEQLLFPFMEDK